MASHSAEDTELKSTEVPVVRLSSESQTQVLISYNVGYRGQVDKVISSSVRPANQQLIAGHRVLLFNYPLTATFPISGRTSNTLVTPPPPSLFFRIIGLQTFSLQIIEPQRFTSKLFICSALGEQISPRETTYRRMRAGLRQRIRNARRLNLTTGNRLLATAFQRAFPALTLGAARKKHYTVPLRTQLILRRAGFRKCAGHACR